MTSVPYRTSTNVFPLSLSAERKTNVGDDISKSFGTTSQKFIGVIEQSDKLSRLSQSKERRQIKYL